MRVSICLSFLLFQSTLLMRGATRAAMLVTAFGRFQSTLLMRGATLSKPRCNPIRTFQSTLLMRGATLGWGELVQLRDHFNPRSSCEERLNTRYFC